MNDRPTPETDRRIIRQPPRMCGCGYKSEIVYATLARRLERERDEAREEIEKLHEVTCSEWPEDHARRLERERDEARAETNRIRDFMDTGFSRAKEELDDTRTLLREIYNLTQIGDPHPAELPMKALQAIAGLIDGQWKEVRK